MTRGITRITYNHLGLPVTVTLSNGNSALFTYSGEGEKLRALYTATDMALFGQGATPVAVLVTTRVDYRPGRVYVGGGLAYAQVPGGYCTVSADTLSAHMTVSDYRGDVRSVIAEDGRVEERNDYYPYGMAFYSPVASVQPWKHSGKEHESRLGIHWLDFGARRLDFAKGQWTTVDPLCEKTPWQSPYAYCGADPVNKIDPDGRDDYFNEKGEFVWRTETGSNVFVMCGNQYRNITEVDFSDNYSVIENIGRHYLAKADKNDFILIACTSDDSNPAGGIFSNNEGTKNYNIYLTDGYVNKALGDCYNFECVTFHESTHRYDCSTHGNTIGEVYAIILTAQKCPSWQYASDEYIISQASYAEVSINTYAKNNRIPDEIVQKLNHTFTGYASFELNNNNFITKTNLLKGCTILGKNRLKQ